VSLLRIRRTASRAVTILLESPVRAVGTIWVTAMTPSLWTAASGIDSPKSTQFYPQLDPMRNRIHGSGPTKRASNWRQGLVRTRPLMAQRLGWQGEA
jgi:hypothetical protein